MNQRARILFLVAGGLSVVSAHAETFPDTKPKASPSEFSVSSGTTTETPLPLSDVLTASTADDKVMIVPVPPVDTVDPLSSAYPPSPMSDNTAASLSERSLGEVFIDSSKQANQGVEFYGQGSRPVSNGTVDRHSVYQDRDAVDPTEFGGGVKFNATDNFSISVEAGGELESDDSVDVDSGAVKFQLSY